MFKNFSKDRHHEDSFSQFMFGKREHQTKSNLQIQNLPANIEKYLNDIDVNLLYENINLFMATVDQLKPLYHQISPVINKFLKNKS